jgi:hypothetical protein
VTIDIKPGDDPPSINVRSMGKIPVAILSSPTFNAPASVKPSSLTFGASGYEASLAFCSGAEDVNGDGRLDLVCHFTTQLTGFQAGDKEGKLRGTTVSQVPIQGSDVIVTEG